MKVYKFRPSKDIVFALDIMVRSRLFCSKIEYLNDIQEGSKKSLHSWLQNENSRKFAEEIELEYLKIRVCSLTESFENSLLWSHYAGGYDGFAFELDIPEDFLWPVNYTSDIDSIDVLMKNLSPEECARMLLSRKNSMWSYEREYRIICPFQYYRLSNAINRVIVGPRTAETVVSAIYLLGKQLDIPVVWLEPQLDGTFFTRPVNEEKRLGYPGVTVI